MLSSDNDVKKIRRARGLERLHKARGSLSRLRREVGFVRPRREKHPGRAVRAWTKPQVGGVAQGAGEGMAGGRQRKRGSGGD